nr:MAG TPA: docking domain containing protein [Caudoviricetes sp.]
MKENTYVSIITDLTNQLASKSINEAEFKARLTESQQEKAQLIQELETYRSVLESDKDLMDLFNEIKNKNEVTN